MKIYGRLTPGVIRDLRTPLEVVLHQPTAGVAGITVKIWELSSYVDIDGRLVEEDADDDLLLELDGDVVVDHELRQQGRTRFVVSGVRVPPGNADKPLGVLGVKVDGDPKIHEAPIPSTEAELGGQNFEIGMSIEQGGAEVFRSRVPSFVRPDLALPRVIGTTVVRHEDGEPVLGDADDELVIAGRFATLGHAAGETLHVLGLAVIGLDGRLTPCAADGTPQPGELLLTRTHRDLLAYVTRRPPKAAGKPGPSKIPRALCHPVGADGTIAMLVADVEDPFRFFLAGVTR